MEPTPQSRTGQRLCEIFSYTWGALQGSTEDATDAKWRTIAAKSGKLYPVRPRVLWALWQDPRQLVGVRFGRKTRYALIDLDKNSPCLRQLGTIKAALETLGLCRVVTVRSSWSGGLHLYIPLPEPVQTFDLAVALKNALEAVGIEIEQGKCEIFPNVKAYGRWWLGEFTAYNGHRLPLQPGSGSCLLSDDLQPVGGDLERFFYAWEAAARSQDMGELTEALALAKSSPKKGFRRRAAGPVEQWRSDLEIEISEGWTGAGQTNHLIKSIACFGRVFEGKAGEDLVRYTLAIATSRPGFAEWCRHQHEIEVRCRVWAKAAERYYWPLGSEPRREIKRYSVNDMRASDAQARISQAVSELRFDNFSTVRAFARAIIKRARCSQETLYKYLGLWHPDAQPVTDHAQGIQGTLTGVMEGNGAGAQTLDLPSVTDLAPHNERCEPENRPFKNLLPGGKGWGTGGREGLSTDAAPQ